MAMAIRVVSKEEGEVGKGDGPQNKVSLLIQVMVTLQQTKEALIGQKLFQLVERHQCPVG